MIETLFNVAEAIIVIGIPLLVPYPYYCNFITDGIRIEGAVAEFMIPKVIANNIGILNSQSQDIKVIDSISNAIGATMIQSTTKP